jgi:hypothetical protein
MRPALLRHLAWPQHGLAATAAWGATRTGPGHRGFSSPGSEGFGSGPQAGPAPDQAASDRLVKGALRTLYLHIHPDLCADCRPARDQNERSFKLLQVGVGWG